MSSRKSTTRNPCSPTGPWLVTHRKNRAAPAPFNLLLRLPEAQGLPATLEDQSAVHCVRLLGGKVVRVDDWGGGLIQVGFDLPGDMVHRARCAVLNGGAEPLATWVGSRTPERFAPPCDEVMHIRLVADVVDDLAHRRDSVLEVLKCLRALGLNLTTAREQEVGGHMLVLTAAGPAKRIEQLRLLAEDNAFDLDVLRVEVGGHDLAGSPAEPVQTANSLLATIPSSRPGQLFTILSNLYRSLESRGERCPRETLAAEVPSSHGGASAFATIAVPSDFTEDELSRLADDLKRCVVTHDIGLRLRHSDRECGVRMLLQCG
jgi:hypothetical protein